MMHEWKPDMIRFMRDACEFSNYNETLAQIMLPYINNESHICDAGCGLGYLSTEIAKYAGKVTAVDLNDNALSVLRSNCIASGIDNINVVNGDVFSMPVKSKYSAMVFCYFGDMDTIIKRAHDLCTGPIFIFMRNSNKHKFKSELYSGNEYENDCKYLDDLGIPYISRELDIEFGQPLKSIDDAKTYFGLYSRDGSNDSLASLMLLDRLVRTDRDDFPLYYPYLKRMGYIIVNTQDIPV